MASAYRTNPYESTAHWNLCCSDVITSDSTRAWAPHLQHQITRSIVFWCLAAQHSRCNHRYPCISPPPATAACSQAASSSKSVRTFLLNRRSFLHISWKLWYRWKRQNFFVIKADSKGQFRQLIYTNYWRLEAGIFSSRLKTSSGRFIPSFDFILKVHNDESFCFLPYFNFLLQWQNKKSSSSDLFSLTMTPTLFCMWEPWKVRARLVLFFWVEEANLKGYKNTHKNKLLP